MTNPIRQGDAFFDQRAKTAKFAEIVKAPLILLSPEAKGTLDPSHGSFSWHPDKVSGWDNERQFVEATARPEYNLGIVFNGPLLDVDIDNQNPHMLGALGYYLAAMPAPYKWGRDSKPVSHLAYMLKEPFDRAEHAKAIRSLAAVDEVKIELRGGEVRSNMQAMMPGSIHPKGELIKWDIKSDMGKSPSLTDATKLLWALRRSAAAALISARVSTGDRHFFFMALAGMLVRMWQQAEDSGNGEWAMDEAAALDWFNLVRSMGGDEMEDTSRERSFKTTWQKFVDNPSTPIRGGTELAKMMGPGGVEVRNAVFKLLMEDDEYEVAEAALERFVVVEQPNGEVMDLQSLVPYAKSVGTLSPTTLANLHTATKVPLGKKLVPLPNFLRQSSQVQRALNMEVRPEENRGLYTREFSKEEYGFDRTITYVNAWCGFLFTAHEEKQTEEDVKPFLDYLLEVVANGDRERYEWVLAWVADIFQDPGHKPCTLLALTGPQGSGKTILGDIIGTMIGEMHYGKIGSIEDLTKEFNSRVHYKLFVQGDETGSTQRTALSRDLKQLVTDSHQEIVYKGKESIKVNNPARYFFTSNSSGDALRVEPGHERRYTIMEVSPHRIGDVDYWDEFTKWWGGYVGTSKKNLRRLMRFFLDYEYDKKLIKKALQTEEKKAHQMASVQPEIRWLLSRLSDGHPLSERWHEHPYQAYMSKIVSDNAGRLVVEPPPSSVDRTEWPTVVSIDALIRDYQEWHRLEGVRGVVNGGLIKKTLEKIAGGPLKRSAPRVRIEGKLCRPSLYVIPSYEDIRHGLARMYPALKDQIMQMTNHDTDIGLTDRNSEPEGEF